MSDERWNQTMQQNGTAMQRGNELLPLEKMTQSLEEKDREISEAEDKIAELQRQLANQRGLNPAQRELDLCDEIPIRGVDACHEALRVAKVSKNNALGAMQTFNNGVKAMVLREKRRRQEYADEIASMKTSKSSHIKAECDEADAAYKISSDTFDAKIREAIDLMKHDGDYFFFPNHKSTRHHTSSEERIDFSHRIYSLARALRHRGEIDFRVSVKDHNSESRRAVRKNLSH